jgi:hypothetical protein
MKHFNPDSTNYARKDDDDQLKERSPDKERAGRLAERQRKIERAALKRGPWPVYAAALLSLFCMVVAITSLIFGGRDLIYILAYFLISICCGVLAYNFYSTYKTAKSNAAKSGSP